MISPTTTFGEWLAAQRGSRSQEALAEACRGADPRCSIYQARVSAAEQGTWVPSFAQLHTLFAALQLTEAERAVGEGLWKSAQLTKSVAAA